MLLAIGAIIQSEQMGEILSNATSSSRFLYKEAVHRPLFYPTEMIFDLSFIQQTEGFSIFSGLGAQTHYTANAAIIKLFIESKDLSGNWTLIGNDGLNLSVSKNSVSGHSALNPMVITFAKYNGGFEMFLEPPLKDIISGKLTVNCNNEPFHYVSHYKPGDNFICIAGNDHVHLPYGQMPPMENSFTECVVVFGGLLPEVASELWDSLRKMMPEKTKKSFSMQGPSTMIPVVEQLLTIPYNSNVSGVCFPVEASVFERDTPNHTCIPLGAFDLKSCSNTIYMDAIKVSGGWQLYFAFQPLPSNIPLKKRPAVIDELSKIIKFNDVQLVNIKYR